MPASCIVISKTISMSVQISEKFLEGSSWRTKERCRLQYCLELSSVTDTTPLFPFIWSAKGLDISVLKKDTTDRDVTTALCLLLLSVFRRTYAIHAIQVIFSLSFYSS